MNEDEWYAGLSREEKERYDEELDEALAEADEERVTRSKKSFTRHHDTGGSLNCCLIDEELLEEDE